VGRFGVTANVVIPGTIDTQRPHPEWYPEMQSGYAERLTRIPMARLGKPQEVANAVLYLASELATFITAQELCASGGAVPLVRQTLDEYSAEEF
jgi:NAD(P)-dependent dehydrogenase (short-subunit alcohol dehydrogenase family)